MKKRVMFICSVGGHLTQMLQIKELFNDYNYVLITDKTKVTKELKSKFNMEYMIYGSRQYFLSYPFIEIYNFFKSIFFLLKYNPSVIVTTGARTAVTTCYLAKLFRKKVIFIESFAKRTTPNKSGKMVYPIADTFVVQWESMKKVYPKAKYWGRIY